MHVGSGSEVLYSAGMHNPSRHVSSMCETSSFSKCLVNDVRKSMACLHSLGCIDGSATQMAVTAMLIAMYVSTCS
jgi:isocitrate lyase